MTKKQQPALDTLEWKLTTEHNSFEVYVNERPGEVLQVFGDINDPEVKATAHLVANAANMKKDLVLDHDLLLEIMRGGKNLSDAVVKKINDRMNQLKDTLDKTRGNGTEEH